MTKLVRKPFYGFIHDKVNQKFTGGLTFVNEFSVGNGYLPWAVYKVARPDRDKGHKDFLLLLNDTSRGVMVVSGISKEDMEQHRYQDALRCQMCDTIVYSVMRHDCHACECGNIAIDGGKDYTRIVGDGGYEMGKIDLVENKFKSTELYSSGEWDSYEIEEYIAKKEAETTSDSLARRGRRIGGLQRNVQQADKPKAKKKLRAKKTGLGGVRKSRAVSGKAKRSTKRLAKKS